MKQTTLNALAEPNRLQIVELLRDGPLTVNQVADRLKIRQPQTSKHLKILHEAGMVEVQAEANRRIYRLRPEPLQEMDEWLESFRGIWEKRFDQLEDYLDKLQKKG
ncbi:metalloregulator ArsR/SmtB family transcription factor [Paenibacillus lautus]|uniref:ArsR/SmtB family transcription factor n=1 Tax=Paenibacillus lautus TaxID=1401 RepID=UPI003D2783DB